MLRLFPIIYILFQIQSSHFTLIAPENIPETEKTDILNFLEKRYNELETQWNLKLNNNIKVVFHRSTYEFTYDAKAPYNMAGIFISNTIHLQPFNTLRKKNILYSALSHELAHACLDEYSKNGLPEWLNESFAIYFSNEIVNLRKKKAIKLNHFEDLDKYLKNPKIDRVTTYYYLGLTMQFFMNSYPHEKIALLLKSYFKVNPNATISKTFGEPINQTESRWKEYISRYK